jgi:hypothetical protein
VKPQKDLKCAQLPRTAQQRLAIAAIGVAVTAVMRTGDFGPPIAQPSRQRRLPDARLSRDPEHAPAALAIPLASSRSVKRGR